MIDHRSAKYETVKIEGDVAQVDVILVSKGGQFVGYRFEL